MIRVVVYGEPYPGFHSYRIDGHWGPDGAPLIGIASDPLAEACKILAAMGIQRAERIGYVNKITGWKETTTVGMELRSLPKALPAPRRRPRKRFVVKGSGVPGDG